jgi:hypothetical protein
MKNKNRRFPALSLAVAAMLAMFNTQPSTALIALLLCLSFAAPASAQPFQVTNAFVNSQGKFTTQFPSDTNYYFILNRSLALPSITNAVAMVLGTTGAGQLTDTNAASGKAFFKVKKVPLTSPQATAGDGIDDAYKLQHPNVFPYPLNPVYASLDYDGDGVSNLREYQRGTDPANAASVNVNLYVDSSIGSDAYDGITPVMTLWVMGTHGPMLTIQGAISVGVSGDTVVIAGGTYHDTLLDPGAGSFTLSPQGNVTIQ